MTQEEEVRAEFLRMCSEDACLNTTSLAGNPRSERAEDEDLKEKARLVVRTYRQVDWGGSDHSFETSHNAFKAAMRELEECVKKDGGSS
jgi:hypothetical protein